MSRSTTLGIICGFTFIALAIFRNGSILIFFDLNATLIVIGGTIAATLISYPFSHVSRLVHVSMNAFRSDPYLPKNYITTIINLSNIYRKGGLKKLETEEESLNNRYLRLGVELVVDGLKETDINDIFEKEQTFLVLRHESGEMILRSMSKFAPAFGMVGTLIGLVQVIMSLNDPKMIGPPLAMAMISTFYGLILSNLLFLPISYKLRTRTDQELVLLRLIKEGILGIQRQDNTGTLMRHLNAILPPRMRTTLR